jgi:hypothetical protein
MKGPRLADVGVWSWNREAPPIVVDVPRCNVARWRCVKPTWGGE